MTAPAPRTPWVLRDLARLVRFEGVGFVAIVVCFVGARHTRDYDHQLYWIVGAMAAMLLSGIGWVVWLLVATRKLRQRQRRLAGLTATLHGQAVHTHADDAPVTAPGMTRYHRPGCVFIADRSTTSATVAAHTDAGLLPCPVCIG